MPLTYVYSRLRISLSSLAISALFEESELGLECLAETMSTIMTDRTLSELYTSAAILDMTELCTVSESDIPLREVLDDFHLLTKLVREAVELPEFQYLGQLRAVHLELPNTLILEYYTGVSPNRIDTQEPLCEFQIEPFQSNNDYVIWATARRGRHA